MPSQRALSSSPSLSLRSALLPSSPFIVDHPFALLSSIAGNHICADCSAAAPDWASLNLAVLLCIECSGIHRNLGAHLSKVKLAPADDTCTR